MKCWNRVLWGVEFSGKDGKFIIGDAWQRPGVIQSYDGEPTRALLFCTRRQARAWCKAKLEDYKDRSDCCADWKFRAVKVREKVTPV